MASRYTGFTMVLLAIFIVLAIAGLWVVMPRDVLKEPLPWLTKPKENIVNNPLSYEYKMSGQSDSQHISWQLDQIQDQLYTVRLNQVLIGQRLYVIEKFLAHTREIKPESLTSD